MKFPRVILETRVSPADKAAIMGGNVSAARQDPGIKIRIVQTGERNLLPILTVEQETKPDAMGVMQWTPIELPWQVIMALYARKVEAITKSHEERVDEVVRCVRDAMTGTRGGDEFCITVNALVAAVDRGLAKWRSE